MKYSKSIDFCVGYARFIARIDRMIDSKLAKTNPISKAWHHPAGPKVMHPILILLLKFVFVQTVFFWAPAWKWSLVIAGISDLARPAHKLSMNNQISLVANGAVYTRW